MKDFLTFPENRTIDLCFCLKKACRGTTPSSRTVGRDESVPLSVLSSVIATSHTWPGSTSNMDGVAVTRLPTGRLKAIDISLSVLEAGSLKSTCQKVGSLSWALQENRSQVCPRLLASLLLHGLWLPPSTFQASSAGLSEGPQNLNPFFHYQHFSKCPFLSLFYL